MNDFHEDVKAVLDPQGRGRQFLARGVQDLTNTRQAGYVLTREKGAGRKSLATYQLEREPPRAAMAAGIPLIPRMPLAIRKHQQNQRPPAAMPRVCPGSLRGIPPWAYPRHTQGRCDKTPSKFNGPGWGGGYEGYGGYAPRPPTRAPSLARLTGGDATTVARLRTASLFKSSLTAPGRPDCIGGARRHGSMACRGQNGPSSTSPMAGSPTSSSSQSKLN